MAMASWSPDQDNKEDDFNCDTRESDKEEDLPCMFSNLTHLKKKKSN